MGHMNFITGTPVVKQKALQMQREHAMRHKETLEVITIAAIGQNVYEYHKLSVACCHDTCM